VVGIHIFAPFFKARSADRIGKLGEREGERNYEREKRIENRSDGKRGEEAHGRMGDEGRMAEKDGKARRAGMNL
jgi:hypothetical protein